MSTRSSIAIENEDGSITGIYCHNEGYLDGVGYELTRNFTTTDEVKELIMLGGLSTLYDGVACAYHRDRGEDWEHNQPIVSENWKEHQEALSQEFDYLWKDNQWYVSVVYDGNELVTYNEAVAKTA